MTAQADSWRPYEPMADAPWNLRRVVHLHRRAGFAATWTELQRDLAGEPAAAITRLISGKSRSDGQPPDYETTVPLLIEAAVSSQLDRRLKAAWTFRMLFGPDPLTERLVLMWHNHFATSNRKVKNLAQMQQQNDVLRRYARAGFDVLLRGTIEDPAMLVWLDADRNQAGNPNENLGRELLELFTLGVGHYTEADVQQAARALTGWKIVADEMRFDPHSHDDGEKTILGQTGKLTGDDLLKLLVAQPATAHRVAWRICRLLLGEGVSDPTSIESLAAGLRKHDLSIGWAVEMVIRSERFFSEANIGSRIGGPPEFVVGAVRALECFSPPPSTLLLADWMSRMGQDLFYPPNVGGWDEGKSWLTSGAVVSRANFARALVAGRLAQSGEPLDLAALIERHANTKDLHRGVAWLCDLLFGGLSTDAIESVVTLAQHHAGAVSGIWPAAVVALLARPEAHLE